MHQGLNDWVEEIARLTKPDRVVWCDGSDEENERLIAEQLETGSLQRLDEAEYPNSFLARSDPNDVARVEHLTFICCEKEADAGPTNNWMSPEEAESRVKPLYEGAMKGRTMYVVPFIMGPPGSDISEVGERVEAFDERGVRSLSLELVESDLAHAGHDPHVRNDVRRVGDLDADLGDVRSRRAHDERHDIHRAAFHGAFVQRLHARFGFFRLSLIHI